MSDGIAAALTSPRRARLVAAPRRLRPTNGQVLLGLGLAMLAVLIVVTVFAPLIAPFDPSATSPNSLAGPSAQHWLGTDSIGRDVLSRLIVGGPDDAC